MEKALTSDKQTPCRVVDSQPVKNLFFFLFF